MGRSPAKSATGAQRNHGQDVWRPARNPMATVSPVDMRSQHKAAPTGGSAPDPQLVAEMKQEIRILVEEIAQLATQDITPASFYAGFISRVVAALAAAGGAVWTRGASGKLKLEAQVNFRATGAEATPADRTRHGLLLNQAFAGQQ